MNTHLNTEFVLPFPIQTFFGKYKDVVIYGTFKFDVLLSVWLKLKKMIPQSKKVSSKKVSTFNSDNDYII